MVKLCLCGCTYWVRALTSNNSKHKQASELCCPSIFGLPSSFTANSQPPYAGRFEHPTKAPMFPQGQEGGCHWLPALTQITALADMTGSTWKLSAHMCLCMNTRSPQPSVNFPHLTLHENKTVDEENRAGPTEKHRLTPPSTSPLSRGETCFID